MFIGRLGKDPELNQGKIDICKFSIAVDDNKKVNNEWVKKTLWVNCVAFGNTANFIHKKARKGSLVFVEGKLDINQYTNNLGEKKSYTQIVVSLFKALEKFERVEQEEQQRYNNQPYQNQDKFEDFEEPPF
jgi:single-strand DNA-binding protein